MKFGYAIVIAMLVLVAVAGFASADRLPRQVPENQVFTVDTIIDATGQVSDSSSMQWVLDDQNIKYITINRAEAVPWVRLSPESVAALTAAGVKITVDQFGLIESISVPESLLYATDDYAHTVPSSVTDDLLAQWHYDVNSYDDLVNGLQTFNSGETFGSKQTTDEGQIHDSKLNPTETIMLMTWSDELRSNGGKIALNKNIDFDSKNKVAGMSNLQVEKVLTYASTEGAHLNGAESWTLDVAGNYAKTADTIRCVFAASSSPWYPAFCNVVKAQSELVNINSAQVSTKGAARGVAATGDVPAALSYQIAVTPDSNSGSGFADGTVKTKFSGSIMEARQKHQVPSATNTWKDAASVSGGIKNFQKVLDYSSGFSI